LLGFFIVPVALGNLSGSQVKNKGATGSRPGLRRAITHFRSGFLAARYIIGTATLPIYSRKYLEILEDVKPDLVHAMRIPFEGILVSKTPQDIPLVVSIWGNDLTLHGVGSPSMTRATKRVLTRANGLLADANRDIRLARQWGYEYNRPTLVIPGGGGIDMGQLNGQIPQNLDWVTNRIPAGFQIVINPRGFRPGSVRNDTFFKAIPLVLEKMPNTRFICPGMAGQVEAVSWITRLGIDDKVVLLPYLEQNVLWDLFKIASLSVSISSHDGTPNSLLEAMACGCFPVVGDIESIREWIVPGVNGLLVDPDDPVSLAENISLALSQPELRKAGAEYNRELINERAGIIYIRAQLQVFYHRVVNNK
jgi:glycosyltransferase involved in cell wall biosynthesis